MYEDDYQDENAQEEIQSLDEAIDSARSELFHLNMLANAMNVLGMESAHGALTSINRISECLEYVKDHDRRQAHLAFERSQEATANMMNGILAMNKINNAEKDNGSENA